MLKITVKRENGLVETIDISKVFGSMNQKRFDKIKADTKAAGKGDVLSCTSIKIRSNMNELRKAYNNLNNEGYEGYVPENEYFEALPAYKEWEEKEIIK